LEIRRHNGIKPKSSPVYLRLVPLIGIGLLLFYTFRLYTFAYFSTDDFINFYWVQPRRFTEMISYVINPASDFFRPAGTLLYWITLQLFDREPAGYHAVLWSFHAVNVALVYTVLRRFTVSQAGAIVGAVLFASQHVFGDIYWSFGTIFEVVGLMLYLTGMLVWSVEHRSLRHVVLASVVFLLALKAKEMAITLPLIWLAHDLLIRRNMNRRMLQHFLIPAAVGAWYGFRKLAEMTGTDPGHPYYMDLSSLTLGRGFGGYFNMLFAVEWRWQIWAIAFSVILLLLALLKKREAVFFQLYVFVVFLPVIFLINHRHSFYWYFPMLGICGLCALMIREVKPLFVIYLPPRMVAPLWLAVFAWLCHRTYIRTSDLTEERRLLQQTLARDYRGFVSGLRSLSTPEPGETLYFRSRPQFVENDHLLYATQFALRRTDVQARFVDTFPENARYRLGFEKSMIVNEP